MARICRLIEQAEDVPPLADLAAAAGLSPGYFHRIFKAVTGVTPKDYAVAHRAGKVREELVRCETVTEAIYGAGFNSNGRFYEKSGRDARYDPLRLSRRGRQCGDPLCRR